MALDHGIAEQAKYWATAEIFDGTTRAEISSLLHAQDNKELTERFYRDLEFGTGGMRGIIGAGSNRINVYNVRKATAALAGYIQTQFPQECDLCVAISYDSRRYSRVFAKAAAEVLAANGIQALITKSCDRHHFCRLWCVTISARRAFA